MPFHRNQLESDPLRLVVLAAPQWPSDGVLSADQRVAKPKCPTGGIQELPLWLLAEKTPSSGLLPYDNTANKRKKLRTITLSSIA